jgi:hypothetical protein
MQNRKENKDEYIVLGVFGTDVAGCNRVAGLSLVKS